MTDFSLGLATGIGLGALALAVAFRFRKRQEPINQMVSPPNLDHVNPIVAEYEARALKEASERVALKTEEAETRATKALITALERCAVKTVSEATQAVVPLPTEEMKGRLIGREGRNIRSFEQIAGVDLLIDDTPQTVVISSIDPIRRETARLALLNLMADGRVHPARIEELHRKAEEEIKTVIAEAGNNAAQRAGISGIPGSVLRTMGRLKFRYSLGQNVLEHSIECAHLAGLIAGELNLSPKNAKLAAFLHDIGKALPSDHEGGHAIAGMNFLKQNGFKEIVLNAVGAHHYDIEPEYAESHLVIIADSLSASRPGARRESLDAHTNRVAELENLAQMFPGVEKAYASQAGREIRIYVKPQEVSDLEAIDLANQIARKVESELQYPGQVRVVVIRETRAIEIAQ